MSNDLPDAEATRLMVVNAGERSDDVDVVGVAASPAKRKTLHKRAALRATWHRAHHPPTSTMARQQER